MPENIDESLLLAIERYKDGQETSADRRIIRQALVSKQIIIVPAENSKIVGQSGGADFGELNEIRVSGSVIGTQSLSGFTTEQVVELLRLYDSAKEISEPEEPTKKKRGNFRRRILITLYAIFAFFAVFFAGFYFADLVPPIKPQYPIFSTALALIPSTVGTNSTATPTLTKIPTSVPTSTYTSSPITRSSHTISLTPALTYTPFPTNTLARTQTPIKILVSTPVPTKTLTPTQIPTKILTSTPTPTNTSTPTPEVIFTDTFDDYEYSTNIGWILFTEEEGKIYRRRITHNKGDNKFEHRVDCFSQTCVGRNEIPQVGEYINFRLSFDIEYIQIPPSFTGLSRPIICINFRQVDPRNFYALCFKSDGEYRIARYVNGDLTILRNWESTQVLNRGTQINSISLTANRGNYLFEANGIKIAEFVDDKLLSSGSIELVIYSFQDMPDQKSDLILEIDNVEIIEIP